MTHLPAIAQPHQEWRLYVTSTGEPLGSYGHFGACAQAAATRTKGLLSCKPDVSATSAPTTATSTTSSTSGAASASSSSTSSTGTTTASSSSTTAANVTTVDLPAAVTTPVTTPVATVMQSGLQIAAAALPKGALGYAVDRVVATAEVAPASERGAFRTTCDFSHMAYDDPIVYPGQTGASHLHTFFGNTGTNAASTPESLRTTGNSTCRGGTVNRSAYWVPTMIDTSTGTPIPPDFANIYYKESFQVPLSTVTQPMPPGLRMIAGTPSNSAPGQTSYRFVCLGGPNNSNDQYGSSIPDCDAGAAVVQQIFFPPCWDGQNLDSPDHKSHMAYPIEAPGTPAGFTCPATHPVALPQVTFNISYTVPSAGAARNWRLSSDTYASSLPAGYSSHGDWFNGWKQEVSDSWGKNCVAARKDCHSHLLGDGREIY